MPMKVLQIIKDEADETTRRLIPSLKQIYNRKRTVFKSRAKLDLQHTLDIFMRKRMVGSMYALCPLYLNEI
jgi:energy-converting hydrogenase A subunit M